MSDVRCILRPNPIAPRQHHRVLSLPSASVFRRCIRYAFASATLLFFGATSPVHAEPTRTPATPITCDEGLKTKLSRPLTTITAVKAFRKGDDLAAGLAIGKAADNLCMVRLLVGPGNAGPVDAPSTSDGVGIEVWLPSPERWNKRFHALGGGGWSARPLDGSDAAKVAGEEGAVSAITDAGHKPFIGQPSTFAAYSDGSFMFDPDGKVSRFQWQNYGNRGVHEMAVTAKALAALYYGQPPRYSYFVGGSNGGRQGHVAAQAHPEDFDGIVSSMPALAWPHLMAGLLYPHMIMQRDLGRPLTPGQISLVSSAAVSACDHQLNGDHDGFVSDADNCRYDPVKDPAVLCESDGGRNKTDACVTKKEALVINKIWYGLTVDGSVPDPAADNGSGPRLAPGQLWFGPTRGTNLIGLGGAAVTENGKAVGHPIAIVSIAIMLNDIKLAPPTLKNPSGDGQNLWSNATLADLERSISLGEKLEQNLGPLYGDDVALGRFKARDGKMLVYHGVADESVSVHATTHYFESIVKKMGGLSATTDFYRYYQVPGMGHFGPTTVAGLAPDTPAPNPPMPEVGMMYEALVNWVEKGVAPEQLVAWNSTKSLSRPLCLYPAKLYYTGKNKSVAASYTCK